MGERITSSAKHHMETWEVGEYRQTLVMRIHDLVQEDFTNYTCIANSAHGKTNATMTVYGEHNMVSKISNEKKE